VVTQQGVSHKLALTASAGDATAPLSQVVSLARDASGNFYATDQGCAIHKISPAGLLTTLAGGATCGAADGKGTAASFASKLAITVDAGGNIYVGGGATIRKITPDGTVTTLAGISMKYGASDGDAQSARFGSISGIAVDAAGAIYVADAGGNIDDLVSSRIRKLTPAGTVSTLAGGIAYGASDGAGAVATFRPLNGLTIDKQGNLFVADAGNHTIRKITPAGVVSTLAGTASFLAPDSADGIGAAARFKLPYGLATDSAGNVYVSDSNSGLGFNGVRKITPAGEVTTITGNNAGIGTKDGPASEARFARPEAIALHSDGTLFVADTGNRLIRKISAAGITSTLAGNPGFDSFLNSGDGTGAQATFFRPTGIVVGRDGVAYIADAVRNSIRKVGIDGVVTTLAGSYQKSLSPADGQGAKAGFSSTNGIAMDSNGNLYVADNHAVRKVDPNGNVTTLAGSLERDDRGTADGGLAQARFGSLSAIAIDASGNFYLTDSFNHNVRKITPAGVVTTLAGTTGVTGDADGPGSAASFNGPHGIALDKAGNVYVADTENNLIRRIGTSGEVTTVAGKRGFTGNTLGAFDGALNRPMGLAFDGNGALMVTSANGVFKLPLQEK
jgi:sugar lactone lactonase YvrE